MTPDQPQDNASVHAADENRLPKQHRVMRVAIPILMLAPVALFALYFMWILPISPVNRTYVVELVEHENGFSPSLYYEGKWKHELDFVRIDHNPHAIVRESLSVYGIGLHPDAPVLSLRPLDLVTRRQASVVFKEPLDRQAQSRAAMSRSFNDDDSDIDAEEAASRAIESAVRMHQMFEQRRQDIAPERLEAMRMATEQALSGSIWDARFVALLDDGGDTGWRFNPLGAFVLIGLLVFFYGYPAYNGRRQYLKEHARLQESGNDTP